MGRRLLSQRRAKKKKRRKRKRKKKRKANRRKKKSPTAPRRKRPSQRKRASPKRKIHHRRTFYIGRPSVVQVLESPASCPECPMAPTTQSAVPCLLLNQSRLTLQNLQGLLQAGNLGCKTRRASFERLCFLNACPLDLGEVLLHCVELCLHTIATR